MKKFFYVAVLALAFASCGKSDKKAEAATQNVTISEDGQMVTEMAVATEVLPEEMEVAAKKEAVKEAVKGTN
ncbi:MAG: hypothetical protein IIV04_06095 [Bacteroidaceae bacterium]|nr:hypothetical protein [Bacteroidaceae bacterium]